MPAPRRATPRSLADDLRSRSDEALAALLVARPDLAHPVPSDTTSLAARASTRASVQRALDQLDAPTLQVLEALAALGGAVSSRELARACGTGVGGPVRTARAWALVWGPDTALRLVRTVADVLGPYPAGVGPGLAELAAGLSPSRVAAWCAGLGLPGSGDPVTDAEAVAGVLADRQGFERLLAAAPDGTRRLLDRLTWDGPVGSVENARRPVPPERADGAVDWLLARGVLVPLDDDRVVLPREAGISLRGGRVLRELTAEPPQPEGTEVPPRRVDNAAAGTAADAVRLVHDLAELWSGSPAAALRGGGVGVRELRRVASTLDVEEQVAARVVEIAYVAGLVGLDGGPDPTWMPTPAYDSWEDDDTAARWAVLASAWLGTSRVPGLVGTRDGRDVVRSALSDAVERPSVVQVRGAVLDALARTEPGTVLAADSLTSQLEWSRPRGPAAMFPHLVQEVLDDAAWLGVTALGALSAPGRALAQRGDHGAALAALLPDPVHEVLLQADLTAVAPGPLATHVARELALMASVDSRGGATVYRFTDASVRRALDAGRTAADVLDFLQEHSRTPVPQPLEYLVTDAARRHGRIRVGGASAYLRSDDESVLGELLADRRTAVLRLRRLAPTVLAAQADPVTVLTTLRELGLAPAAEGPDGAVVLRRPDALRTPPLDAPRPVGTRPAVSRPLAEAVVEGLRRGDATEARHSAAEPSGPVPPAMDPAVSLAELRSAAADRRRVWVGISDPGGRVARRLVEPLGVSGGRITVFDHGVGEVRTLSVHRVTGVVDVDDGTPVTEAGR